MAAPWESDPVVEAPRAPAAAGLSRGAPWEADAPTPTVTSALPDVSGNKGGLPWKRTSPIPTAEEAAGLPYIPQPPSRAALDAERRRQVAAANPVRDKVVGAVEGALDIMAKVVGGTAGSIVGVTGLLGGGGGEKGITTGAEKGIGLVRDIYRQTGITTGEEPQTEFGQTITGGFDTLMEGLPAAGGVHGTLTGAAASARPRAAASPIKAITDVAARAAEAMQPPEAGAPAKSVGAKAVDVATQRRERAASLPVPVKLTKGDAERTFEQQQFEKETAKNPEIGKPLRERKADQGEAILKNFEEFVDQTGAADLEATAVGKSVTDPIMAKAVKAKKDINEAYNAAEAAGETAERVPTDTLVRKLNEVQSSKGNAGVIGAAENELIRLGGAARGADGELIAGDLSLGEFNELRKLVGSNGGKDQTNAHFAGEIKAAIDVSTADRGGELYQQARKMYSEYAAEFKNQGVIRDLIGLKKNSTDRKTALAEVFDRSVLRASAEDLKNVRRTLTTAGDGGVQAWNDLRGKTIDWLKEQATASATRDERGNRIISPAALDKAVKKLDKDGRLEILFDKQGAQQLRDVSDIAADVFTAPPGAVNTSNTASALLTAIDTMATYLMTGGSVPLPAMTLVRKGLQNFKERKLKAKVRYALGPDDPVKGSPTKAFKPEPPSTPPAPPTPKPPPAAPTAQAALPGVEPAKGSRGTPAREVTKRERELTALRDQVTDAQVIKDIDAEIAAERRAVGDTKRAAEYRAIAAATTDPELKAKFTERADKLAPAPPKKPEPAPEPIPVGEATELDVQDATLDMVKATAEAEVAWRKQHRLGDQEAARAKATAEALQYDAAAVERAAQQHENSPRAFDREVQRIVDEGKARETQVKQGGDGGEGLGRRAEAGRGEARPRNEPAGPDSDAAAGTQRAQPAGAGREAPALSDNPITARLEKKLEDHPAAVAEYAKRPDSQGGTVLNTDIARELSSDYLKDRTKSADVHEPSSAFIKRVYAERLAGPTPAGKERVVLFTAGGTGAGKTTGVKAMGDTLGQPEIVYDTNMNSLESSATKIEQALAAGRDVRILYTYADPVEAFYQAMSRAMNMERREGSGRTVPIEEHIKTHVGAREVIPELMDRYKDDLRVDFFAIDNSHGKGNARQARVSDLPQVRDNGLREVLERALEEAHARGDVSDAIRQGFLARSSVRDEGVGQRVLQRAEQRGEEGRQPGAQAQGLTPPADLGATGTQTSVVTERGLRVPVQYRLADIGNLVTSHDDALKPNPAFDPTLQPRDRARMSSEAQITRIENGLQPELLADSPKASDGAPIVGPDGIVESGNARTIALRRAYAGGKAEGYRAYLEQNAARFGLKPEDVRAMKRPALVRERTVDVDRADFAKQANESPVSAMSDVEQAKSDAGRLPDLEGLVTSDDGQVSTAGSAEFIRQFMRYVVSPSEQNQLMTADGRLSQRGANRIRNAIFAKAYNDPDMVAMMAESTDANVRNILAGMLRAAPEVARLRTLMDAGARAGRDFVPDLVDAVRRFSDAREAGQKVEQALAQGSLIGGEAPAPVADLMRMLEADSRAPKRIAENIRSMVGAIDSAGDPRQEGLFQ